MVESVTPSREEVEDGSMLSACGIDSNSVGITILLVTHEPDIAEFASRIIVVKDGRIKTDRQQQPADARAAADAADKEMLS